MLQARRSRLRRGLLALLLGTIVALLAAELGLRWQVLSDSALARSVGAAVRNPERFATRNDDAYWKLLYRFDPATAAVPVFPDRLCGWITGKILPGTHEHVDEQRLGTRTPVLLYGDSFAEGVSPGPGKFEELLEASPVSRTHALLNYGVGGYGTDQALLLLRDTLPRWAAREPVAILAIMVEDDLDRCTLGFRCGVKPRFRLEAGELVDPGPVETNVPRFLEQQGIGITSYLWRLFVRGDGASLAEKQELAEALVRAACRELRAHARRPALMLMRGIASVQTPEIAGWQEDLIRQVAGEEGLPVLDPRAVLLRAIGGNLDRLATLYIVEGPLEGHWNFQGNLVVSQLLRAFIEGEPPEKALEYVAQLVADGLTVHESEALGGPLLVQVRDDEGALCFAEPPPARGRSAGWHLGLRAGNRGPTFLRWSLPIDGRSLAVRLRAVDPDPAASPAECVLRARQRLQGEVVCEETLALRPGDPAREWRVELQAPLELIVEQPAPGQRSPWILLEEARLE
jgi:hypothetical protein